jgi:hypothetical protein
MPKTDPMANAPDWVTEAETPEEPSAVKIAVPAPELIPAAMRALPRWVVWRYEPRKEKPTKVPYNGRTATRAASNDPQTWCTFEQALDALATGRWSGIGFMLGDGFVGIDLDKCRNPETGDIDPGTGQVIRDLNSYTEVSPSGCGIHIIAKGSLPDGRRRQGNIEMYDAARYFTITGKVYGDYREIAERQSEIEAVHARVFSQDLDSAQAKLPGEPVRVDGPDRRVHEQVASESLILDPNAEPPFDKFEALCANDSHFSRSWAHQRTDLGDQSQSSYDMSLASLAARVGWSDQEITNLLIANRRKHKADLKLRPDYYRRTIATARRAAEDMNLDQRIEKLAEAVSGAGNSKPGSNTSVSVIAAHSTLGANGFPPADEEGEGQQEDGPESGRPGGSRYDTNAGAEPDHDDARRRAILQGLTSVFGVQITRIIKYVGEPAVYALETTLGDVQLGKVDGLIEQPKLRNSVASVTGRFLPPISGRKWPLVAQALLDACESIDRGEDATVRGTVSEWLRSYLAERSIHPTLEEADEGREPFFDAGAVAIFSTDLRRWLQVRQIEHVTQCELTADLRAFGAEPEVLKTVVKGRASTRSVWKLPAGPWIPVTS